MQRRDHMHLEKPRRALCCEKKKAESILASIGVDVVWRAMFTLVAQRRHLCHRRCGSDIPGKPYFSIGEKRSVARLDQSPGTSSGMGFPDQVLDWIRSITLFPVGFPLAAVCS
ncbi:hypothetical protein CDAR_5811 [Caerostris darwini]|uniref:Uncharacterized protein n=1 Tax=Caerostris darwini TaxID=1538125 RepID=A0AAV4RDZ8_9ARAC|nr:hypothetical protein CDAR_5811 [Caerostris darwini]